MKPSPELIYLLRNPVGDVAFLDKDGYISLEDKGYGKIGHILEVDSTADGRQVCRVQVTNIQTAWCELR